MMLHPLSMTSSTVHLLVVSQELQVVLFMYEFRELSRPHCYLSYLMFVFVCSGAHRSLDEVKHTSCLRADVQILDAYGGSQVIPTLNWDAGVIFG